MTDDLPQSPHVTEEPNRMARIRDLLVSAADGRPKGSAREPSGWYVRTGEGSAIAAGSEDLQKVDVDKVFGPSFEVALHSVAEVGSGRKAKESPSRLAEVQRVYDRMLAEHTD